MESKFGARRKSFFESYRLSLYSRQYSARGSERSSGVVIRYAGTRRSAMRGRVHLLAVAERRLCRWRDRWRFDKRLRKCL